LIAGLCIVFTAGRARAASSCEWNGIERVVAIGDVHGAYDRFVEILKVAGIIDADQHWAGGTTHLVQLGDVVDRGADSRKALDLIRRLEREARSAGGAVHMLLGNHEVMRMLGDLRMTDAGEYAGFTTPDSESTRAAYLRTLRFSSSPEREKSLKETVLGFAEMRMAFGRDGDYGRWLRQLPVTINIDGLTFVHGGISPAVAPMTCDRINDRVRRDLTEDLDRTRAMPLDSLAVRPDGPLWFRGLALEPDTFAPQVDEILAKHRARAIVVAHTVLAAGRIATRFDGRVIQIDTGMQPAYMPGGRASALEIKRGEATAIYVDRRDEVQITKRESVETKPEPGIRKQGRQP
jgi:diadenosine tetraphosphatase ApaH/serine/threonine PP2A family protein phosphatase